MGTPRPADWWKLSTLTVMTLAAAFDVVALMSGSRLLARAGWWLLALGAVAAAATLVRAGVQLARDQWPRRSLLFLGATSAQLLAALFFVGAWMARPHDPSGTGLVSVVFVVLGFGTWLMAEELRPAQPERPAVAPRRRTVRTLRLVHSR